MTALVVGLSPGAVIDGYKVIKPLGDGGFAFVYLVERNGKLYALKVARHRETSGDDKRTHARTLRELGILLLFAEHPNIVQACGYGYLPDKASGNVYLVLDYVDGWTLAEWLERKHPTVHEVLSVFATIAAALAYMHSRGVLHRDLKLANVLISKRTGEPIIIDLGAASHALAVDLTEQGLPPGTDRFRAPEQFRFLRQHKEEHRARYAFQVSDEIFAFGAMLYDVLTDPRPTEERPRETLNHTLRTPEAVHALNPRVPVAVSDWVASLLSRDPSDRPVDTEALRREAGELATYTSAEYSATVHLPSEQRGPAAAGVGEPGAREEPRKRPWAALSGLVAACLAAALAVALWPGAGPPAPAPAVSMAPLERAPVMSTPDPARAVDTGPAATADTQKEGSSVTPQKPEAPKQVRAARAEKQPLSATCKTLAFAAAVAAGCTGAPIRPEPFECPERTVKLMWQLGWISREGGERFTVGLDDRFPHDSKVVFRPGAEVVSFVPDTGLVIGQREKLPPGTTLWGRVYVDPKDETAQLRGEPAAVLVKYERAKLPGKQEVPVCMIARSGAHYSMDKDGATRAENDGEVEVITRYP